MKKILGGVGIVAAGAMAFTVTPAGQAAVHSAVNLVAASETGVPADVLQFFNVIAGDFTQVKDLGVALGPTQLQVLADAFNPGGALADYSEAFILSGGHLVNTDGTGAAITYTTDSDGVDHFTVNPDSTIVASEEVQGLQFLSRGLNTDPSLVSQDGFSENHPPANPLSPVLSNYSNLAGFSQGQVDSNADLSGQVSDLTSKNADLTSELAGLQANPWLAVGTDLTTVQHDLLGQDGGSFADLFSNAANTGNVGDLTLLSTDLTSAFDYSFGIDPTA